jgi:hypothetical protein
MAVLKYNLGEREISKTVLTFLKFGPGEKAIFFTNATYH